MLVAAGTVDGAVDFSGLTGDALKVDGDAVTITLPAAKLTEARLDLEQTRVVDTDKGLGNRIGDLFSDDADSERKLLLAAQEKLEQAAREDPQILEATERNTRQMLEGMMRGLGFTTVTVVFGPGGLAARPFAFVTVRTRKLDPHGARGRQVRPAFGRTVPATPENVAPLRHAVVDVAIAAGADEHVQTDVALAVGEACANVVVHAYPPGDVGPLIVQARRATASWSSQVSDRARAWSPGRTAPASAWACR